jgi:hypothetical protein
MAQTNQVTTDQALTPDMARTQALVEMKAAIRQLRRDVVKREDGLDERRARAKDFLRSGRDERANEEMELFLHDEAVLTDLRMILGGQERALSTARAHASYQQFAKALDSFAQIAQLAAQPATNVELEIMQLSERLRDAAESYGDVDSGLRRERSYNPALAGLRDELEHEIAAEDARSGALAAALTDRQIEERLQAIQQQRAGLRGDGNAT